MLPTLFHRSFLRLSRIGISFSNEGQNNVHKKLLVNCFSESKLSNENYGNLKDEFNNESYDKQVYKRRMEAQRSILVQVHSEQSCSQLHEYCSKFGTVSNMFHYTGSNSTLHFILMEFEKAEVVKDVLQSCGFSERSLVIPSQSHMLWFRSNHKKRLSNSSGSLNIPLQRSSPHPVRTQLLEWMQHSDSISDQILILYRATMLDELGTRLRYLTAYQLEAATSGLFPSAQVMLFGSSSNGFGRQGCDLDLVLKLDSRGSEADASCRLMFQTKPSDNARSQTQRHIDGLADLVQWVLPGCSDVRRILMARVPIVKFRHEYTGMECDLSVTNMTAVYMSELLYTYGAMDWRLRPLVFTIKRWASEVGLTNPSPGRWITNFSLTLLVIFYLQQSKILPSLDTLRKKASKSDKRVSEDGVNCTFLRDVTKISISPNPSSLESLMIGLFEYYAAFDFATQGISLGTGSPVKKRDHSALHITNPLETNLNVSQNVSLEETERLKMEFRNAAWELESMDGQDGTRSDDWGLLRLWKENKLLDKARHLAHTYTSSKRRSSNDRLVPVSKLFQDEQDQSDEKSDISSIKNSVVDSN